MIETKLDGTIKLKHISEGPNKHLLCFKIVDKNFIINISDSFAHFDISSYAIQMMHPSTHFLLVFFLPSLESFASERPGCESSFSKRIFGGQEEHNNRTFFLSLRSTFCQRYEKGQCIGELLQAS